MNQNTHYFDEKNPVIIMSRPTDREAHVMWILKMFYGDKNDLVPWIVRTTAGGKPSLCKRSRSAASHTATGFSPGGEISRRSGIRETGGKRYRRALGQGWWEKAPTPRGGLSRVLEESHSVHCVFSREANRFTSTFPNLLQGAKEHLHDCACAKG